MGVQALVEDAGALDSAGGSRQDGVPVFASIPARRAADLMLEVADMMAREAAVRRSICLLLDPNGSTRVASTVSATLSGVGAPSPQPSDQADEPCPAWKPDQLRDLLTVHQATWLSGPYLNEERLIVVFESLAGDMVGF